MRYFLSVLITLLVMASNANSCHADDPCEGMDDIIIKLTSELPGLSGEDFRKGKFLVTPRQHDSVIRYTVKNKVVFERAVQSGPRSFHAMSVGGFSALFYRDGEGQGCCSCSYIVAPSPQQGKFLLIPGRTILGAWKPWQSSLPPQRVSYYQEKDRKLSQVLYHPLLGGQIIDHLKGMNIEDIDSDGEVEIVTTIKPSWAYSCNFSNASRPYWRNIYHLSPGRNTVEDVSMRYPKVYSSIVKHLQQSLQETVEPRCTTEVKKLLKDANRLDGN